MHDRELCLEVLRQIEEAAIKIGNRFQVIHQASDFTDSPAESKNSCLSGCCTQPFFGNMPQRWRQNATQKIRRRCC